MKPLVAQPPHGMSGISLSEPRLLKLMRRGGADVRRSQLLQFAAEFEGRVMQPLVDDGTIETKSLQEVEG